MTTIVTEKKPIIKQEVKTVTLRSYWLALGELRLDASFHTEDVAEANRYLKESGYDLINLRDLSQEVFTLSRIKRYFSNDGTPYLMPSELFSFPLRVNKRVIAEKIRNVDKWFLKDGWIVITCSGRIGVPLLITKRYEDFIASHDLARIIPNEDVLTGYLCAYLSTWLGHALLTKHEYGGTVGHIEPHHINSVPVPNIPIEIQASIDENIKKVYDMRERADSLLKESEKTLLEEVGLPLYYNEPNKNNIFTISSSDLMLRFDVSYHLPLIQKIQKMLRSKCETARLGNVIDDIFFPNRFKRFYVKKEYGLPFLSGKNIVQIKPYDIKYISKKVTKDLQSCIIRKGWVLITRSGTSGRIAFVPSYWDGWTASEHIIRVIPNQEKIDRGYLTAFLQTEYGYQQMASKIYGGVVDELSVDDLKDIVLPLPPRTVQERIGQLVVDAYELKELANQIEDDTVKTLEDMLTTHQKIEDITEQLNEVNAYTETVELLGDEEFREGLNQTRKGELTPYDL